MRVRGKFANNLPARAAGTQAGYSVVGCESITRLDRNAGGRPGLIVSASPGCRQISKNYRQTAELTKPIVARIDGNNAVEGRRILTEANHPLIELVETMDGAARRVAQLAAGK